MYGRSQTFLKSNIKGLLCSTHLVYCFFEFISYSLSLQRENNKYIQLGRIKTYKLLTSPPSCPDYPACPHILEGVYCHFLSRQLAAGIIQKWKSSLHSTISIQFQAVQYINNFQGALPERDGDGKVVRKLKLKCFPYETCSAVQRHKITSK